MICNHFCNRCNRRVVTPFGEVNKVFSATYGGSRGPVTVVTALGNSRGDKAFRPGFTLPKKEKLGDLPFIYGYNGYNGYITSQPVYFIPKKDTS